MADSVYSFGLDIDAIEGRIGAAGPIDATSQPTEDVTLEWLTEACATVQSEARNTGGLDVSTLTPSQHAAEYHRLRGTIADFVAAKWLASNQRDNPAWAALQEKRFDKLIEDARKAPERVFGPAMQSRARSDVTAANLATPPTTLWHEDGGFN